MFTGDVSLGDNPDAGPVAGAGMLGTGGVTAVADAGQGGEMLAPAVGGANQGAGGTGSVVAEGGQGAAPAASGGSGGGATGGADATGGDVGDWGGATASAGASGGGTSGAGGTGGGWIASVENDGDDCDVPPLSDLRSLPDIATLPDPFTKLDRTRLSAAADWRCRREELRRQAERYVFGTKPTPPEQVSGTVTGSQITVSVTDGGNSTSFSATVTLPSAGVAPYPVLISYGPTTLDAGVIDSLGVAVVTYDPDTVGMQGHPRDQTQKGAFYELYDGGTTTGLLVAWSWGLSRIIDVIQRSDGSILKWDAVGVSGCSMYGKGAFIGGAMDQRVALTMPIESGTAGVPIWRGIALDENGPNGSPPLSLSETYSEQPWFADAFQPFVADPAKAPIDTHDVVALVAPRGLFIMENQSLGQLSSKYGHVAALAGAEVYAALGARDNVSYDSDVPETEANHCMMKVEWIPLLRSNIQKFLTKDGNDPGRFSPAADQTGNLAEWRDWTTPTLN